MEDLGLEVGEEVKPEVFDYLCMVVVSHSHSLCAGTWTSLSLCTASLASHSQCKPSRALKSQPVHSQPGQPQYSQPD